MTSKEIGSMPYHCIDYKCCMPSQWRKVVFPSINKAKQISKLNLIIEEFWKPYFNFFFDHWSFALITLQDKSSCLNFGIISLSLPISPFNYLAGYGNFLGCFLKLPLPVLHIAKALNRILPCLIIPRDDSVKGHIRNCNMNL